MDDNQNQVGIAISIAQLEEIIAAERERCITIVRHFTSGNKILREELERAVRQGYVDE